MDFLTSLYLNTDDEPAPLRLQRHSLVIRNEKIKAAFEAGKAVKDIAAEFGLALPTIYQVLNRAGISCRVNTPTPLKKIIRNTEIIEKYKAGASVGTLGNEYGVTRERICQILRPHNLTNLKAEQKRIAREETEAEREAIIAGLKAARENAIEQAVEIVRAGGSRNDAIRVTGLPVYLVQQACKDAGLPHYHGRWHREADNERRRIRARELRAAGKTWAEIKAITAAEGDQIDMNWVARHCADLMGTRQPRKQQPKQPKPTPQDYPWSDDKIATLCRMYFKGCSAQQIADVLGQPFTRNSIIGKTNRLRAAGLLKPPAV